MDGLSSNWKKLQAKLNSESGAKPSLKRKHIGIHEDTAKKSRKIPQSNSSRISKPVSKPVSRPDYVKRSQNMGAAQSSLQNSGSPHGYSPSLALWANENDISSEALAEAYGLGSRDNSMISASKVDRVNHGLSSEVDIGKYIAMDCEMVGIGTGGHESALARVSIVDFHGRQVYDSYVKPQEAVTDWRTAISGVSRKEMRFAREFKDVQKQVSTILDGRVLVGHDLKHDLDVLLLTHPTCDIRDTAKYHVFKKYANGRKPALRILAQQLLGAEIQAGPHSSIEDARVTMLLFRKHKPGFDVDNAHRFAQHSTGFSKVPITKKSKRKKK